LDRRSSHFSRCIVLKNGAAMPSCEIGEQEFVHGFVVESDRRNEDVLVRVDNPIIARATVKRSSRELKNAIALLASTAKGSNAIKQ